MHRWGHVLFDEYIAMANPIHADVKLSVWQLYVQHTYVSASLSDEYGFVGHNPSQDISTGAPEPFLVCSCARLPWDDGRKLRTNGC